jgi:hypothetical protein
MNVNITRLSPPFIVSSHIVVIQQHHDANSLHQADIVGPSIGSKFGKQTYINPVASQINMVHVDVADDKHPNVFASVFQLPPPDGLINGHLCAQSLISRMQKGTPRKACPFE